MKNLLLTSSLLISFILIGCSARTALIMDEYKGEKLTGKNLTIIKLFDTPSIANMDDVIDDLGAGVPIDVYNSFFNENFVSAFKNSACCNNVNFIKKFPKEKLEERILDINDSEQMKILLPNEKIENDSISADFLLFIDNLIVSRIPGSSGMFINGQYSGGSFGKLYHQIYFALWDNTKSKIAAYGRIEEESTIVFGMTKGNWESIIRDLSARILSYTPF
ncbi:MAG TPA: hypothetical protein VLN45_02515, partial [Ignavibacteriaceae bacterium]|nr:hypothetical protein [Ignavibacteriaceae bacterium]